jgi:two-component system OmpR family sensor kinase
LIRGATTSVLAQPDQLSPSAREQLTIADEESEHLRELLDNAIEMARLDTTHIDVHLERSDLQKIVREVAASMLTQIDNRPLEIIADEALPPIPLDKRLVRLALKQLLDNALKYSPPDSAVAIRVGANGASAFVDVVDRGAGISPEDQARVFERFYRGRQVRAQIPGSGLGLTIAFSIMKAHHGDLALMNHPGETTFRMTLPLDQAGGHL